jgi:hypothetical protein|tara:strand:- start:113 stop:499 length:387 start_codon:yes stop_codon:yes gene_type:complete
MARPESKLYSDLKKITKDFQWTRLENWASLGTPDLLGFHPKKFFFTLELKVTKRNKVALSPHQVSWHLSRGPGSFVLVHCIHLKQYRLYPGSRIEELFRLGLNLEPLVLGSLDACACSLREFVPVPEV